MPAERLAVTDGVIHDRADANRRISYADLIGGGRFDASVTWNGQLGLGLAVSAKAQIKEPRRFRIIGKSPPRRDLPGKVFGTLEMAPDVRLPGMLHARMIRPQGRGRRAGHGRRGVDRGHPRRQGGPDQGSAGGRRRQGMERRARGAQLKVTWSDSQARLPRS